MLKAFYILLFVCVSFYTNAQSLHFEKYTTKDGLLSNDVYNLHQDNQGYLWFFTNYGAMKYNGESFQSVLKNLPFNESFIYCIYENENGRKWVANSNAKIFEIIHDSAFIVKGTEAITEELKKNTRAIYQICVDDSLNIYINTNRFSYKSLITKNYKSNNLTHQLKKDQIHLSALEFKGGIFSIGFYCENKEDELVKKIEYINGVFYTKNEKKDTFHIKYNLESPPKYIKKFGQDIYISTQYKIFKLNNYKLVKEIALSGFILNFTKDKNNHLWVVCYNDGLYEIDEHDSIVNHYFENKTVNDILIDTQNGMWISTEGFGLYHCKNLNELHFNETELLGRTISFIKQLNNKLFISNTRGALFLYEKNSLIKILNEDLSFIDPLDIIEYNGGYLITYRTGAKIIKLNKQAIAAVISKYDYRYHAYKLVSIGKDSMLYAVRKGINIRYKNELIKMLRFDYKTNWIEIRNHIVYIATEDGVYELINNQLIQPTYLLPTKNKVITKIVKDNFNNYWFCSKGSGLFKLASNNKVTQYTISNNLPSNIIYDVSFGKDNSILLCTNKGLFYNNGLNADLKNWKELYAEEVKSVLSYNHTIYLATNNGLITIKENKIIKPIYLNLTSILVNGVLTDSNKIKHLKYNQNNLECNVDIISYSTSIPKMMYELTGTNNQGGISENQHVSFQNLAIGNYTLTLSLITKEYNVKPIVVTFSIVPAYWQTTWFKLICIIAILICCFIIVRIAFRYYKNKEDKKNEANKLITEYKLIALKAQINPHFMSNCLTAIQHLILSNKVDEANQYLAKFSLLVRQVLNFSSKPLVSLSEELEITELNIELEQLRFENKFLFEVELYENTNLKTIFVPPLLLQPITENAIWHGLLPLKKIRKGKLIIKIKILDDLLYIYIEDNGVGRKKGNSTIGNMKESKGILITKQRIENINVLYNTTKADLFYEDLIDDNHNPIGTRVVIILPLNLKTI